MDTTLVSALSSTGAPRRYQNPAEGAALRQTRRAKKHTYPELLRPDSRCRLVVLALGVGGRFSPEAVDFVQKCAASCARRRVGCLCPALVLLLGRGREPGVRCQPLGRPWSVIADGGGAVCCAQPRPVKKARARARAKKSNICVRKPW